MYMYGVGVCVCGVCVVFVHLCMCVSPCVWDLCACVWCVQGIPQSLVIQDDPSSPLTSPSRALGLSLVWYETPRGEMSSLPQRGSQPSPVMTRDVKPPSTPIFCLLIKHKPHHPFLALGAQPAFPALSAARHARRLLAAGVSLGGLKPTPHHCVQWGCPHLAPWRPCLPLPYGWLPHLGQSEAASLSLSFLICKIGVILSTTKCQHKD